MATTAIQPNIAQLLPCGGGSVTGLAVPWRDPHTVPPAQLAQYISDIEKACVENPDSSDLHTVLGMAHAMNFDVYKSMDALEAARAIDPQNFFAQLKFSELYYRIRALHRAERETMAALDLAANSWQISLARKQLLEIRRLMRDGTQKPEWTKSLFKPFVALAGLTAIVLVMVRFL